MSNNNFSPVTISILEELIYGKKDNFAALDFDAPDIDGDGFPI